MIHVEGLIRKYGETLAVDGISFDISTREVVGFLGPNGAGKTTTLRVLAGFLHPSGGVVRIADRDVTADPLDCRRLIGYLPENNPLYEEMEVYEYLDWCASMRGLSGGAKRTALHGVIGRCGLSGVVGKDIGQLSKGFRQRVGLAAAMAHDPPILLLDEPTSGLDPNQALEMRNLISELRREKTVLYSSHILSEVRASCDRVIIIHNGKIAAQGRPEELTEGASREQKIYLALRSEEVDAEEVREKLMDLPGVLSAGAVRGYARDGSRAAPAGKEKDVAARYSRGAAPSEADPTRQSSANAVVGAGKEAPPSPAGADGGKTGEIVFELAVGGDAGDLREKVFKLAVKQKWPVLELRREMMSLEEVFRSLTA